MKRIIHVCIDIKGALRQRDLSGMLTSEGRDLTDSEARAFLKQELQRGYSCFVGCDNRDSDGRCAGHPTTTENNQ